MKTIAIRLFAPAVVVATTLLAGCSGSGEAVGADSEELSAITRPGTLDAVDHAAYGVAQSAIAKTAGITKWRLGAIGTDVVVDGVDAAGRGGFQFRLHQERGITSVACKSGHAIVLDAKGKVLAMTLDAKEQKMFGAAAADLDDARAAEMDIAYLSWGGFWRSVKAGFACAAAAVEGGANVGADIGCVIAVTDVVTHKP